MPESYTDNMKRIKANIRVCDMLNAWWQGEDDIRESAFEWRKELEQEKKVLEGKRDVQPRQREDKENHRGSKEAGSNPN